MAPYFGVSAAKLSVFGGVDSMGMIWWLLFLFTRRLLCFLQTGSFSFLLFPSRKAVSSVFNLSPNPTEEFDSVLMNGLFFF